MSAASGILLAVLGDTAEHTNNGWFQAVPASPYYKGVTRSLDVRRYGHDLTELHTKLSAEALLKVARARRDEFLSARPFPHVEIDGLFPEPYLAGLSEEFPEFKLREARHVVSKSGRGCGLSGEKAKCSITDEGSRVMKSPYARGLYSLMLSPDFVDFLEALTGIKGVISDNSFTGSGFDQTLPGGSLGIHTDFHFNPRLKLVRRINVFLYLNHDWRPEYGGDLELWSATNESRGTPMPRPRKCVKRAQPLWNRLFVFATGDHTFHGHPMPLNTTDRNRRSVAMYYYTNGQAHSEVHEGETVLLEGGAQRASAGLDPSAAGPLRRCRRLACPPLP